MLSWLIPRRLALTPANQVQAIVDHGRRILLMDGGDPFFTTDWRPGSGWWLIDVEMDFDGDAVDATMYFDWGTGFTDAGAIRWPLSAATRGGKRLVRFIDTPRAVRFDPCERRLIARRLEVQVRRVTAGWAESRIRARIDQALRRGLIAPTEVERGADAPAQRPLDEWYGIYDRMFRRGADPYAQWIAGRERHLSEHLLRQPERAITIDLLVPVWNTDPVQFETMIASVLAQSHPRWRLLLVDDGSTRPETLAALAAAPGRDARISVHRRAANGGITAASQTALELAQADWAALLDHDDVLHPHALRWIAEAIHARPEARVIYTDEDKVASGQGRSEPFFKPDFNPELLLAQNYICHFLAFHRATAVACGGFRSGFDGAQDHDFLLRLTGAAGAAAVVHLPVVAYHWRMSATSTAAAAEAKPYARAATVRAVTEAVAAIAPGARVEEGPFPNTTRIRWPLPEPAP
ncbi:MAG: hypothetical protein RLZZ127_2542, partial [Planctomycetota bacterium]